MIHSISYDLNRPGQDYPELWEAIKGLGDHCHALKSMWLVSTFSMSAQDIFRRLEPHIDKGDHIIIVQWNRDYWGTAPKSVWEWITQHS